MLSQHNNEEHDVAGRHPLAAEEWMAAHMLECVADPRAVCKLALLNKNFYAASKSDLVWQRLLPPAGLLDAILADSSIDENQITHFKTLSKRDLYFQLCKSITYGGELKKFWLDPATGGDCYMISAKSLSIAWGDSPQHWEWKPCPGSWFAEVAHLKWVCWFDTPGTFRQLLRPGSYVVSFRMQLHSPSIWRGGPVKLSVQNTTYAHLAQESEIFFDNPLSSMYQSPAPPYLLEDDTDNPSLIWIECDAGQFTVDEDDNEGRLVEVKFTMQEVKRLYWKTGFVLDGVIIRPRYVVDNLAREKAEASSFMQKS